MSGDVLGGEMIPWVDLLMPRTRKGETDFPVLIIETHLSRIGFEAAAEDIEKRGFSGTVVATEEDDLAGRNLAGNAVEDGEAAEGFGQILKTQDWCQSSGFRSVAGCSRFWFFDNHERDGCSRKLGFKRTRGLFWRMEKRCEIRRKYGQFGGEGKGQMKGTAKALQ